MIFFRKIIIIIITLNLIYATLLKLPSKNTWYSQASLNGSGRIYHSVILASNKVIYIMGGYFQSDQIPASQYANFSQVIAFDTKSSQWSVINATGDQPSSRIFHSTTQSKIIYIYIIAMTYLITISIYIINFSV